MIPINTLPAPDKFIPSAQDNWLFEGRARPGTKRTLPGLLHRVAGRGKKEKIMAEFTVRYWFGDGASGDAGAGRTSSAYVSAGLMAESSEEAARIAGEQLSLPVFAIDSDGYGRVVINSARVRLCSILPARTPEEATAHADAQIVARTVADFASRAEAAGVVDTASDAAARRY